MKTIHYALILIFVALCLQGYTQYERSLESTNMTVYPESHHENLVPNPDFNEVKGVNEQGYYLPTGWSNAEKGIYGKPMYTVSPTGINGTNAMRMTYIGDPRDTSKVRSVCEMYAAPILGVKEGDILRLSLYVSGYVENAPVIVGIEAFRTADGKAEEWISAEDAYVHNLEQRPQIYNVAFRVPNGTKSIGVYAQAQELNPNSKIDISIDHVVVEHITPKEEKKYVLDFVQIYYKMIAHILLVLLFILPSLMTISEIVASIRNSLVKYKFTNTEENDYSILIPIYGNIKYLENVGYLKQYGNKVMLCTSGNESEEFYTALKSIATENGFKVFIDKPTSSGTESTKLRSTGGTKRDTIIRHALFEVGTYWTVCLDADSTTDLHMSYLVGEIKKRCFDVASVRLKPNNANKSIIAKLQYFEYDLAMNLRFLFPYLLSGACHAGKTNVLLNVMQRHSLFFQGNDIEAGILAKSIGAKVGHIPFIVNTSVPDTFYTWIRQRIAWNGGEWRLFAANMGYIFRYPILWIYGLMALVVYPMRIFSFFGINTPYIVAFYAICIIALHARQKSLYVLLMPLYALFQTLVLTPLGIVWYFKISLKHQNFGIFKI